MGKKDKGDAQPGAVKGIAGLIRKEYKLVVLGDGGVGKSSLTIRFVFGHFVETYNPTIEDSYRKMLKLETDDEPRLLDILDTAGQEDFTALRDVYIRDGHGFLIVYSMIARTTFEEIGHVYEQILRVRNAEADPSVIPIVLIGQKCDLEAERVVQAEEGRRLAEKWGCPFIETSARDGTNVDKAFELIVQEIETKLACGAAGPTKAWAKQSRTRLRSRSSGSKKEGGGCVTM